VTAGGPRRNRVTPFGEIVAVPERGTLMGNRGILVDREGRIVRSHRGRRWICCLTAFRGRRHPLDALDRYTPLFFLDEATALAAGHRPCWECRRADARAFRAAWERATGAADGDAEAMDRRLHDERLAPGGGRRLWTARAGDLADGAMVAEDGRALLVAGGVLAPWSPGGYGAPRPAPGRAARVRVITPPGIVAALAHGYRPALHPSAPPAG
jgi:hypothetical protein